MEEENKEIFKEGYMIARLLYGGSKIDILKEQNQEFGTPKHFDTYGAARKYIKDNKINGILAILPVIWQTFEQ